ncbi:hypothetical protein KP509_14G062100 [Ceratopteris richardii]|uniref:Two-component response regulator n=1 Tax=Ceratopteris richardii TaxID=49495 RepID=A0A8T2TAQ8_CERRI|nr:hypothetical protein KP509_14G062100 [Ceratopteris richardii]
MENPAHSILSSAPSSSSNSSSSWAITKVDDTLINDTFPVGLRVLVVDDDPICLLIVDRMLQRCQYRVTTCGRAVEALSMLRENRNSFDVIISDVCMPDMDGFKLLELVGLEMDLPVIMMSANGETSAVMKGVKHGACDYLLKPVRMEELRNIWQHVVRKKWRNASQPTSYDANKSKQAVYEGEHTSSANGGSDGTWKRSKKRKDMKEEEDEDDLDHDDSSSTKKPRVVWSVELHQQFVNAVNQLGIDKAVPKRILELMNVQGLTRENVASHLQKYRLYLKRISGVAHQTTGALNPPFPVGTETSFSAVNAAGLGGLNDLRTLSGTSSSTLISSLQSGALGRLNVASLGMGNVDPSVVLRLAAFQGGHGALTRPPSLPSCAQPILNTQRSFQTAPNDINQVQISELGFTGSLDKGLSGVSVCQQRQLAAMATLGGSGKLPMVGNGSLLANTSTNALLMQTLQQQQAGGHPNTMSTRSLPGSGGQRGLAANVEPWAMTTISGPNDGSLQLLSVQSSANSTTVNPTNSSAEDDSKGIQMPNLGNAPFIDPLSVSSPLFSSEVDEVAGARIKNIGASGLATSEGLLNYASKYPSFSGLKQERGPFLGSVSQRHLQGFDASQEQSHSNDCQIKNPSYSPALPSGQENSVTGMAQGQDQPLFTHVLRTTFPAKSMNNPQSFTAMKSFPIKAEGRKIKEEGHLWAQEPLSEELLTILLKQQEGLGFGENDLGGSEGYAVDKMYVK